MSISIDQAKAMLSEIQGPGDEQKLLDILKQLSVEAEGNVTVLYSGVLGKDAAENEIYASKLIDKLINEGASIRTIKTTDAARFLDLLENTQLVAALNRLFPGADPTLPGSAANEFLNKGQGGAWATVSGNFVKATQENKRGRSSKIKIGEQKGTFFKN